MLDPIVAIRQSIIIDADESARIDFVTGVARTRDDVFALIEKYRDKSLADRVFDLAWSHGQVILQQLERHRGRRTALTGGWKARSSTQTRASRQPGSL